ncbi:uncharacterized protein LOC109615460 [Esox lucius]|uniref:uncharacterized protein LOC109615460 n=1 Tax=Esox lucius TaxID=8010 RepID=UPI001476EE74|nr:uncharacterized protein LOC109615460 [Esox lucius]
MVRRMGLESCFRRFDAQSQSFELKLPKKNKKTLSCEKNLVDQHQQQLLNKQKEEKTATLTEIEMLRKENLQLQKKVQELVREKEETTSLQNLLKEIPGLLLEIKRLKQKQGDSKNCEGTSVVYQPPPSTCIIPMAASCPQPTMTSCPTPLIPTKTSQRLLQDLMSQAFSRHEMASHSLTGGSSNANAGVLPAPQLDKIKMDAIFFESNEYTSGGWTLKEAARNKLSNERKLLCKEQNPD